jgi:choline-sulfatase
MRRIGWAASAAGLALALALAGCEAGSRAAATPMPPVKRLVLITIDTLRADHVGVYGGPVPTPAMNGLAAEGARVTGAYTPTPSTAPAHASLFTGLHPWHHGVLENAVPLVGVPLLAEHVQRAGIPTAAFVSSYILHPRFGLGRGFDTYHFAPSRPYVWRTGPVPEFWAQGDETTDAALAWIDAEPRERFFLWVHYFDPHDPYRPPPGFEQPRDQPISLQGKSLPPQIRSFAQLAALNRGYRGEVAFVDAQVGRLIEGLRSRGLLDNAAVILTADHGEGLGDHGWLTHGENLFEEQVRVPLLVRAPGVPAGRVLEGLAQLEDLAPTALHLLGVPVPPGLDGHDLVPWMRGEATSSPRHVVLGRRKPKPPKPELFYEQRGAEKWIGTRDSVGVVFDLAADPREAHAHAGEEPPAALAKSLATGTVVAGSRLLDPESRRALQALGYLGDGEERPEESGR